METAIGSGPDTSNFVNLVSSIRPKGDIELESSMPTDMQSIDARPNTPSNLVNSEIEKTAMCTFHPQGRCAKGSNCPYAHDISELREAPDLRKTSLCVKWQKGKCKHRYAAHKCRFAHGEEDLRPSSNDDRQVSSARDLSSSASQSDSSDSSDSAEHDAMMEVSIADPSPIVGLLASILSNERLSLAQLTTMLQQSPFIKDDLALESFVMCAEGAHSKSIDPQGFLVRCRRLSF
jgi:hypothetical protein